MVHMHMHMSHVHVHVHVHVLRCSRGTAGQATTAHRRANDPMC